MTSSKEPTTTETLSNAPNSQHIEQPALFVLKYGEQHILVTRPQDYTQLQCSIRDYFPDIPWDHRVSYYTDNLAICHGILTKISPEVWASIIPTLDRLIVRSETVSTSIKFKSVEGPVKEDTSRSHDEPPKKKPRRNSLSQVVPLQEAAKKTVAVYVVKVKGDIEERHPIYFSPSATIQTLLTCIASELGFAHAGEFQATWHGRQLEDNSESIASLGLEDQAEIYVVARLNHVKSFIYLLLPEGDVRDISVSPLLAPEWHFSAVYPLVPIQTLPSGVQKLRWDVRADFQGTYKHKNTGIEISCLSWKSASSALLNKAFPFHASPTRGGGTRDETYVPGSSHLEPTNSVVVSVENVVQLLENMMRSFYVPVEARTAFISYWLPSFLKYTHIALRLLPKSEYVHAPPLDVSPSPDVLFRVCMLFKGLKDADLAPRGQWQVNAKVTPCLEFDENEEDRIGWEELADELGTCYMRDYDRFRVVELAGLEVLS